MNPLQQQAETFNAQATQKQQQVNKLVLLRIAYFLAAVVLVVLLWEQLTIGSLAIAFVLWLVGFMLLVRYHKKLKQQQAYLQALAQSYADELLWQQQKLPAGVANGESYIDPDHPFSADLDLFGPEGLLPHLNRTTSPAGTELLAHWLLHPAEPADITARQQAAAELAAKEDFRHQLRAQGLVAAYTPAAAEALQKWLATPVFAPSGLLRLAAVGISGLFFICIMAALAGWVPGLWVLYTYLLTTIIAGAFVKPALAMVNTANKLLPVLQGLQQQLTTFNRADLKAERLSVLQHQSREAKPEQRLHQLIQRMEWAETQQNAFFFLVIGGPLLMSVHLLHSLSLWHKKYAENVGEWQEWLAELEVLSSFGAMKANLPNMHFAEINKQQQELSFVNVRHPFIPAERVVPNSFAMQAAANSVLVTGSNMAGKSTFQRTLGVNLVLAFAGAPVFAESLKAFPCRLFTSMRTRDSLSDDVSTFYAEIMRLRDLLQLSDQQPPVFYLLDELLRGTNSDDRHRGVIALIKQLADTPAFGLIATHDLRLTEWQLGGKTLQSYRFESDLSDGELSFDYKLKEGVSRSFSASALMQQMGLKIDEVW